MTDAGQCTKAARGVRIAGSGIYLPERVFSNHDLEQLVETNDEWIRQRTGIRERRHIDPDTEGQRTMAVEALTRALADSEIVPAALDMVINATLTAESTLPANANRIAAEVGAIPGGAFDLVAGCAGFVYGMNMADMMIRSGHYDTVAVIGCEVLSRVTDYTDRGTSILFGDGAGAMILSADEDPDRGCLYQCMQADGTGWDSLYIPEREQDIPEWDRDNPNRLGSVRMKGREVFKFAVSTFCRLIEDAMEQADLSKDDVSQFICHQSNIRIINAAMEKLDLPRDKVHINIEKYGNMSAASIPVVYEELKQQGELHEGDTVIFVAFGAGLSWCSNVWKL